MSAGLVASPFLNYEAALRLRPHAGTDVLADLREPYFNRTYGRYCSHQNTPNQLESGAAPGSDAQRPRRSILPHRLGKLYHEHGARVHRQLFANALALVYPQRACRPSCPAPGGSA